MEEKKTKITDFIKYLEDYQDAPARVLTALKFIEDKAYKQFNNIDYIEDIEYMTFLIIRHIGKKSWFAFEDLREDYLQNVKPQESELGWKKEEFSCRLSSAIVQILKTIENKSSFVERALLEKFERDGIKWSNTI